MNPSCRLERLPIEEGRGGDEDVNVVVRQVGWKCFEDGYLYYLVRVRVV